MIDVFLKDPKGVPFAELRVGHIAEALATPGALATGEGSELVELKSNTVLARRGAHAWAVLVEERPEVGEPDEPAIGDELKA